ncbi:MAG: FKBP-type peptidyl-prolyl cis-trans isomerase [Gemmatimonadetes bacterium]|nr:FKBP-type peptidyl-prolyl cis-trans isomerase [Gemmatimonadota bacterium]NNF12768.1 FKBP-type peptidyl-prolyl cis-trans isomerase [Gemmatimonadota bacterium]NNL30498.1 FKBP-type peptidyl-prolyl cis-trans isomerase [Gemmatimonadota bacterium]
MSRVARGSSTRVALAVVAVLGITACGDDNPFQVIEETEFAASLGVDLAAMEQLPGGVYIEEETDGTGAEAMAGDLVDVDYTGWLADGTQFDAFNGAEFQLVTGPGGVITGFRDGIVGMLVGGTRLMVIPPDQAYGEQGSGSVIPPGAILVFRVTLNGVETP